MERKKEQEKARQVHDPPETKATGPGGAVSQETESIRAWLKKVRFRKTLFGGVNEADVWKKIAELNRLYETALAAERMRYDALLAEHRKTSSEQDKENANASADVPDAGRAADEG